MEVNGQLHDLEAFSLGKNPWYPLDRSLGGPESRAQHGGGEKNSQPLPGLEHPIIQPVSRLQQIVYANLNSGILKCFLIILSHISYWLIILLGVYHVNM
jgi:hypothetical protein